MTSDSKHDLKPQTVKIDKEKSHDYHIQPDAKRQVKSLVSLPKWAINRIQVPNKWSIYINIYLFSEKTIFN